MVAEPIRHILADGPFEVGNPRDATSAMLGAAMIATLDRWYRGEPVSPAFRRRLTEQIVRACWLTDSGPAGDLRYPA